MVLEKTMISPNPFIDACTRMISVFLRSQVHRVSNPVDVKYLTKDRFSVVFFATPDDDTVVETLDGSAKYPKVTSGQWLTKRFEETYDIKEL